MRRRPLDVVEHHVDGTQQKEIGQRPAPFEVGAHQERADVEMPGERLCTAENLGGRLQEPYRHVAHSRRYFAVLGLACKSGDSFLGFPDRASTPDSSKPSYTRCASSACTRST